MSLCGLCPNRPVVDGIGALSSPEGNRSAQAHLPRKGRLKAAKIKQEIRRCL